MNWSELADLVNNGKGYHLFQIGWIPELSHAAFMHYQRALIQRIVYHENLFSIQLAWETLLDPFTNLWLYTNYPKKGKETEPVQIIDADVTNTQPLVVEMPYGKKLFRVRYTLYQGILTATEIDPSSIDFEQSRGIPRITHQSESALNFMETGSWIIPPSYGPVVKPIKPEELNSTS